MDLLKIALVFLAIISIHLSYAAQKSKNFCRTYPYAPRCRGLQNKRDLQKLEPLFEEPKMQEYHNGEKVPNEYELNDQKFFDTFISKVNRRMVEEPSDDYV